MCKDCRQDLFCPIISETMTAEYFFPLLLIMSRTFIKQIRSLILFTLYLFTYSGYYLIVIN